MADEATKQFYINLPIAAKSRYIRLLHVQAPSLTAGTTGGPIHCTVTVVDLDAEPHYAALSYVWGSIAPNPDVIFCNDVPFRVTSNCHSALQHLRTTYGAFTIWIDAISLNQQDNLEKAHQVGLMGDIYSSAETTYVWLGEGSTSTDRAIKYLSRCGFLEYYFAVGEDFRNSELTKPRFWAACLSRLKGQYGFDQSTVPLETETWAHSLAQLLQSFRQEPLCTFKDLEAFCACDWISRIWTYQELILSRNPVVVCGSSQISWSRLQFSIIFLHSMRDGLNHFQKWTDIVLSREMHNARVQGLKVHRSRLIRFWTFCYSIHRMHILLQGLMCILWILAIMFFKMPESLITLERIQKNDEWIIRVCTSLSSIKLLSYIHHKLTTLHTPDHKLSHGCSSMRVSIGIQVHIIESLCTRKATDPRDMFFGIHSILEKLGPSKKLPPVDYSLPCAQIYTNLTRYLLSEGNSLLPLALAAQKRCDGAPSWVPDYSQDLSILVHDGPQLPGRPKAVDLAYGFLPYRRFHPSNASILIVKGVMFDVVTEVLRSSDTFKTSNLLKGFPAANVCVGDHVAFISGLPFPIVVRKKRRRLVELIGPGFLECLTQFMVGQDIMFSNAWTRHVKERKKKWVEAERSRLPLGSVIEDKPERYLDDIYIC